MEGLWYNGFHGLLAQILSTFAIDYVKHNFADATDVFDGYPEGPSTKDVTHMCRNKVQRSTYNISTESMPCNVKMYRFLKWPIIVKHS